MSKSCNKYRTLIDQSISGPLEEQARVDLESHIAECKSCRQHARETSDIISLASSISVPQHDDAYWDGFYDQITDRIRQEEVSVSGGNRPAARIYQLSPAVRTAFQVAVAASVLFLGILIGKMIFDDEPTRMTEIPVQTTRPESDVDLVALDQRADRFFDRSKVLLLGIVNADTDDPGTQINMTRPRFVAHELIKESGPLRRDLEVADQQRLMRLMDDLEVILLQIANLEESADVPAIEMVRDGVDRKAVLLKINVTEMRNDFTGDGL